MEALRTKADSLQWEVNGLDAKNHRLRADNPAASKRADLEAELEQSRGDVARERPEDQDDNAGVQELERTREELRAVNGCLASEKEATANVTARVCDLETELGDVQEECRQYERNLSELQARMEQERDAMRREAELDQYRALEAERAKWEAREQCIVDQLESLRRQCLPVDKHDMGVGGVMYSVWHDKLTTVNQLLQEDSEELGNKEVEIEQLKGERESALLQVEEMKAEIALLQAKLKRREWTEGASSKGADTDIALMSVTATTGPGSYLRASSVPLTPFTGSTLPSHTSTSSVATSPSTLPFSGVDTCPTSVPLSPGVTGTPTTAVCYGPTPMGPVMGASSAGTTSTVMPTTPSVQRYRLPRRPLPR